MTEVERGWYESGQLWYEIPYENGEPHGLWRRWYENSQLQREKYYIEGKQYDTLEHYKKKLERRGELEHMTKACR